MENSIMEPVLNNNLDPETIAHAIHAIVSNPNWSIVERIWKDEFDEIIRRGKGIRKEESAKEQWKYLAGFARAKEVLLEKIDLEDK